jgi:uncharacterized membrane protein YidH (DUF202 family)
MVSLQTLARSGAIASSAGVVLMVIFVVVLLLFPVIKNCGEGERCTYRSTAPGELQPVVRPSFFAISLITISAGVLILRLSRWLESKKIENETNQ